MSQKPLSRAKGLEEAWRTMLLGCVGRLEKLGSGVSKDGNGGPDGGGSSHVSVRRTCQQDVNVSR